MWRFTLYFLAHPFAYVEFLHSFRYTSSRTSLEPSEYGDERADGAAQRQHLTVNATSAPRHSNVALISQNIEDSFSTRKNIDNVGRKPSRDFPWTLPLRFPFGLHIQSLFGWGSPRSWTMCVSPYLFPFGRFLTSVFLGFACAVISSDVCVLYTKHTLWLLLRVSSCAVTDPGRATRRLRRSGFRNWWLG